MWHSPSQGRCCCGRSAATPARQQQLQHRVLHRLALYPASQAVVLQCPKPLTLLRLPLSRPCTHAAVDLGPATLILAVAVWAGLYFATGSQWLAGHSWFALASLWISAMVASQLAVWVSVHQCDRRSACVPAVHDRSRNQQYQQYQQHTQWPSLLLSLHHTCHQVGFPRAPAMVLAGLVLAQIPNSATLKMPGGWATIIRTQALTIALLRGGLELEFSVSVGLSARQGCFGRCCWLLACQSASVVAGPMAAASAHCCIAARATRLLVHRPFGGSRRRRCCTCSSRSSPSLAR